MEVGVCAEAYQGEEPLRHINSAFMMFEVLDEEGRPRPLPPIRPEPLVREDLIPVIIVAFNYELEFPVYRFSKFHFVLFSTARKEEIQGGHRQKEDSTRQVDTEKNQIVCVSLSFVSGPSLN